MQSRIQAFSFNPIPVINENSQVVMALLVVGILMLMVIPLPTLVLDLLISFNITLALVMLLVAMYVLQPLDLSAFPSMLLVITLYRLSLNIASTRLILLNGGQGPEAAGRVIMAFGNFVVGGNYVVGAIVFLILVLINFMVITKGAGRIAEVAARFTLDAMPGKQMSIDADLNAGLIDETEARRRRERISREAEYYGAMDGANKFVKGDAIAGIIITLINIIGGLIVGVLQNNMGFGEAAQTYTLLTVGDGLVTQIPALIVATAAGIIVTRAGAEARMGSEITGQIFKQPYAIAIAGGILFCFALIPGLPTIPFLALALGTGALGYLLIQAEKESRAAAEAEAERKAKAPPKEPVETLAPPDRLALEIGHGLIPFVDVEQDGQLLERIRTIRNQIALDIGILVPPVHIQDNIQFRPGEYAILLKGEEIARAEMMPGKLLAMHIGASPPRLAGAATREPTYNLPAVWIDEKAREDALSKGYTVVDIPTVLITHLSELIRGHADELIGRQEVRGMLDRLKDTHPTVVDELVPGLMSLGNVVRVLQNLLRERVPVRDLLTIVETLADVAPAVKAPDMQTEYVRQALARTISRQYQTPQGDLPMITIGPSVEQLITDALQRTDQGTFAALEPAAAQDIVERIAGQIERFSTMDQQPVVVCSAPVRPHLKRLIDQFVPNLVVLSYNEIVNTVRIQPLGTVEINDAD